MSTPSTTFAWDHDVPIDELEDQSSNWTLIPTIQTVMSSERYHANDLSPVQLDETSLSTALNDLQRAIATATAAISENSPPHDGRSDRRDLLYVGDCGIGLMFFRLVQQANETRTNAETMAKCAQTYLPALQVHHPRPGRLSPLDSVVGPAMVYVLHALTLTSPTVAEGDASRRDGEWDAAIANIRNAVNIAMSDESLGGDEVLYGKAGLLWGMLNLHALSTRLRNGEPAALDKRIQDVEDIAGIPAIQSVFNRILRSGIADAHAFKEVHGETNLPLMWSWHGKYYLGAIHGVAGILTVLLQCPRELVVPHIDLFASCVSALCALTVNNDGHLPSSLPVHQRAHPYVQICHGNPGLLLLLSTFRLQFPESWKHNWDEAEKMVAEKIWQEGLVKKGLGICHGVSGNAWALLLQAASFGDDRKAESDMALSRALAMLLHARSLPPLVATTSPQYRTPDHPYSLFEGLAGTVCAWADACTLVERRLRSISAGKVQANEADRSVMLGFPGLGGVGAVGML